MRFLLHLVPIWKAGSVCPSSKSKQLKLGHRKSKQLSSTDDQCPSISNSFLACLSLSYLGRHTATALCSPYPCHLRQWKQNWEIIHSTWIMSRSWKHRSQCFFQHSCWEPPVLANQQEQIRDEILLLNVGLLLKKMYVCLPQGFS